MKNRGRQLGGTWVLLWPALFWTAAFAVPLIAVAVRAADSITELVHLTVSPYYRGLLGFTVKQAGLSTIASVIFGLPGAYYIGRYRFPGRSLLKSIATVPFVLPPILAVLGFILVFGNSGLINSIRDSFSGGEAAPWKILYSLQAIVMAHVFYNFPLTLRIVGDAWSALPQSTYYAARSLGAGRLKTLITVDIPRLAPAILTAAVITFLFCFLSFAIILVLGGGPELSTLEVEIYRLIKYQLNFDRGSALAMMESFIALGLLIVYVRADSWLRKRTIDDALNSGAREPERIEGIKAVPAIIYLVPALFLILAPLLSVVLHSFIVRPTRIAPLQFSFRHWARLWGGGIIGGSVPLAAVLRTLILGIVVAITTTLTASFAGWYSSHRSGRTVRVLEAMLILPLGVSSVILGLGYLIVANRIPSGNFIRLVALVGAHTVMALPFAYRIISGRLKEISPRIPQAARALGAGPLKSLFSVELPLARPALITAAVFSMALSSGELNATIILAPGDFTTMPLAIYRMIGSYDIFGACALGTVLIGISIISFLTLDRYGEISF